MAQRTFPDQFPQNQFGEERLLDVRPQRPYILFLGSANDKHIFQAQFPKTYEAPAPKSQDFQSHRSWAIFPEMQQNDSGRRMCDIRSCLSSVISSAGFGGKDISLSQKTRALYFYKNMDKTSFFLISFQSLKKEKCARRSLFFLFEPQNICTETGFGGNRVHRTQQECFP